MIWYSSLDSGNVELFWNHMHDWLFASAQVLRVSWGLTAKAVKAGGEKVRERKSKSEQTPTGS